LQVKLTVFHAAWLSSSVTVTFKKYRSSY